MQVSDETTREQAKLFVRTIGCVRYVWNYVLFMRRQEYKLEGLFPGRNECSRVLTELKADDACQWLNEVDSIALQTALEYQLEGWERFFRGQGGQPHFKTRKSHRDAYITKAVGNNICLEGKKASSVKGRLGTSPSVKKTGRKDSAGNGEQEPGRAMVCVSAL